MADEKIPLVERGIGADELINAEMLDARLEGRDACALPDCVIQSDPQIGAIDDAMNNRNCRPVIKVYDGFDVAHLPNARPIVADRHGRLWAYHEDCHELRMIHDPEAARC